MKNELVNEKTGKPSNSIDEDIMQKSEYEKRQHPEAPKKKSFGEKAREVAEDLASIGTGKYAAKHEALHAKDRGYKEHR